MNEPCYVFMMFVGVGIFMWIFFLLFLQVIHWAMYGHND